MLRALEVKGGEGGDRTGRGGVEKGRSGTGAHAPQAERLTGNERITGVSLDPRGTSQQHHPAGHCGDPRARVGRRLQQ